MAIFSVIFVVFVSENNYDDDDDDDVAEKLVGNCLLSPTVVKSRTY